MPALQSAIVARRGLSSPGHGPCEVVSDELAPFALERTRIKNLKLVFSGILTQDYWLACGKQVSAETVGKLSGALDAMGKDGTLRKLLTRNN